MSIKNTIILLLATLLVSCGYSSDNVNNARKKASKQITEHRPQKTSDSKAKERRKNNEDKTIVYMTKNGGVYEVPIEVNDVKMYFIFDTGASIVSISETEALFLIKQGSIDKDDILGTSYFSDATGTISEGTIINLKKVKIGNRVLQNIRASVVHNMEAPLLLGQSVLEEFGKISIDYKKGIIELE